MADCVGASTAIDPALVARFKAALERLNPDGSRIGLAVSGGPDSMAMLLLAQEAIPGQFEVATVDHGLRPEAKDECALVVAACAERGVPCAVLSVEVGKGNVQAEARKARYAALERWVGGRTLATAHHADDQAETLLMRLNRGSGLAGLAGIRERSLVGNLFLIRPLLHFRRAELRAVVEQNGVGFAIDPSNASDSYDRVRMRKALAAADWLDPLALSRSACNLADADEAVERLVGEVMATHVSSYSGHMECFPPDDRELALRVVRRIIGHLGGELRGSEAARLVDNLALGRGGNFGGVLATVQGKVWVFRPEPPRRTGK